MDCDDALKGLCDKLKDIREMMQMKASNKVTISKSNLVADNSWPIKNFKKILCNQFHLKSKLTVRS